VPPCRAHQAAECFKSSKHAHPSQPCCSVRPHSCPPFLRQAVRVLQLMLVAAALCRGVGAQYCSPGAVQARCDSVLIVHVDPGDVQARLQSTGSFSGAINLFHGGQGTPTPEQLDSYDAVLVYTNWPFLDAELLGDRLAAYHDRGGGVVVASFANIASWGENLRGRYGTAANGYALLDYTTGGWSGPSDSLGEVIEPQSPLLTNVASFAIDNVAGYGAIRSTATVISGRGIVVARWRNEKDPIVVRGTRGNRTLVELNCFPNQLSGDGVMLLRNVLKYSRCISSAAGEAPMGTADFSALELYGRR
jgi:hypothetical protein